MKKLFYLFLLTALWLVVIVSCQDKVPATGIKLVERTAVLAIGGTKTLKADVIPFSATNREVIWSSSNNNIATV
ncbi:MAG: Ig-like domain-containing protein, partial [Lentimicrobiaceae bacterium]|nr:Ig-like domain-containing protein [Lentimicrobiaceae bacterium]